jgi:Rrf2 family transcriptional regulator, nitric oxide-sensitive transcriptional repressor
MRLTSFSDYALRILIYASTSPRSTVTISDISTAYGISRNHLMKITATLARGGFVVTVRGSGGGLKLARPPQEISIGAVLRLTEADSELVECANRKTNTCIIAPACELKHALFFALEGFYERLDGVRLSDITRNPGQLRRIFKRQVAKAA